MKTFVLGTDILLKDPDAIFGFADNLVIIAETTLEELDRLKNDDGDTGHNARAALNNIASLKDRGGYRDGIRMNNGGVFQIVQGRADTALFGESAGRPDNLILGAASNIKNAILVTDDIAMQVKASMIRLPAQGYFNLSIKCPEYTGCRKIRTERSDLIKALYTDGVIPWEDAEDMRENEYVILRRHTRVSEGSQEAALCVYRGGSLHLVAGEGSKGFFDVTPKSAGQWFALDALASDIPLVLLKGPSKCGKTFLSLAAGLDGIQNGTYSKMIVVSRDGKLPDSDKDDLEAILRARLGKGANGPRIKKEIGALETDGSLEVISADLIRGRNLSDVFVLADDVQNMTPGQVYALIEGIRENSKLVLCGDPAQTEAATLGRYNNGLSYVSEHMKGSRFCAQITFDDGECIKSQLAEETARRFFGG